jgi:hypothetical protein
MKAFIAVYCLLLEKEEIVVIIAFRQHEPTLMLWEHADGNGSSCWYKYNDF